MIKIVLKSFGIVLLFTLFSNGLIAGTDGTIRGSIKDIDGNPTIGASVYIKELSMGAVSDLDGNYIILNIPIGSYDVNVDMIGFQKQVRKNVDVLMDQTVWLNFKLPFETVEGEEVEIIAERALVETSETSKKVTVDKEAIESLPFRDLNDLYSLQAGVVKVTSRTQGIPDHEERGLEELHVRGGRSGEIAYMIDGMYIRNPIYGGIGNGTRLNLFAVKEFDWQADGFNAEYGDAMSAVSNMHTNSGEDEFEYHFKYESSQVGSEMGYKYDQLRGYRDINMGFGGSFPILKKMKYWVSGQFTNYDSYQVYEFDDITYQLLPGQETYLDLPDVEHPDYQKILNQNRNNLVQPWDDVAGFKGFGSDKTWDIFGKVTYNFTSKLRFNASYWYLEAHRKGFNPRYLYWDEGQNELFRDTYRFSASMNHSLTERTFYTIRYARFVQDQFQGVRWKDSDEDGYPDWFELRHSAGEIGSSDPYNSDMVPYDTFGDSSLHYTQVDGRSGWYFGAVPGLYNWEITEEFTDMNGNGRWDDGEPWIDREGEGFTNGVWDGPELIEKLYKRDGSYWLAPDMYEDFEDYFDWWHVYNEWIWDPFLGQTAFPEFPVYSGYDWDSYYYMPNEDFDQWTEARAFQGHDRFYATSRAETNEIRFDLTSQVTNELKLRSGVDFKSHKLNFFEVIEPWRGIGASIQSFAEYWVDTGPDGLLPTDTDYEGADFGEGNGQWDTGENFTDSNGNGKWDDFREPLELAGYIQGTYEVPWMAINGGLRIDAGNFRTQIWSDPAGNESWGMPWFYSDINGNGQWDGEGFVDENGNYMYDSGEEYTDNNENDQWDGETISALAGLSHEKVFLTDTGWFYKLSPRIGFSHIITDKSTFTFNYGLYYQTPIYQNVFLNTNRLTDPTEAFEEGQGFIGNASMGSMRTQSYSCAFNVQAGRHWKYQIGIWVKDIDQWVTLRFQRSGVYNYMVFTNGDFGSARGVDFVFEYRGKKINTNLQYTFSVAKANSQYDWAQAGAVYQDAPVQEFMMPYDRPHDLTLAVYVKLRFGINAGLTGFYQSGYPYTALIYKPGDREPKVDTENLFSKRAPSYKNVNFSLSKKISYGRQTLALGFRVFNIFDIKNALDIHPLSGSADTPGSYYEDFVGLPGTDPNGHGVYADKSGSYYDMPWLYSAPREMNFFIRVDFK